VLFLVQASLAHAGRIRRHRELGVIAATVGVGALLTAAFATWNSLVNPNPAQDFTDPLRLARRASIIWGNLGNITIFGAFLALGVYHRRRADIHRRLMLFASISIVSPALGRIAGWPIAEGIGLVAFNNLGVLLLVLAVVGHELLVDRRVHPLTVVCALALFAVRIVFGILIPATPAALDFVRPVGPG
jgi:hypothetical protein